MPVLDESQDLCYTQASPSNKHPALLGNFCDVTGYYVFKIAAILHPLCQGVLPHKRVSYTIFVIHLTKEKWMSSQTLVRTRKVLKKVAWHMGIGDYINPLSDYELFCGDYSREASNCFLNNSNQRSLASSWEEMLEQGEREDNKQNFEVNLYYTGATTPRISITEAKAHSKTTTAMCISRSLEELETAEHEYN
ncbi:cytochrome c oxidase subunit I [Sesbania bispinosa]|nr:cytochrome c oxidase subunit I [Sesbania bispinosa]